MKNNILCSMKEFWRDSFVKLFSRYQFDAAHKFWCIRDWLYIVHCLLDHFSKNLKNGKITGGSQGFGKNCQIHGYGYGVFRNIFISVSKLFYECMVKIIFVLMNQLLFGAWSLNLCCKSENIFLCECPMNCWIVLSWRVNTLFSIFLNFYLNLWIN